MRGWSQQLRARTARAGARRVPLRAPRVRGGECMAAKQKPTPEDVLEQLRAIKSELDEIKPLSFAERRDLRNKIKTSEDALQASVSTIAASSKVANPIGC